MNRRALCLATLALLAACQEPAQRGAPTGDTGAAAATGDAMRAARPDSAPTIGPDGWGRLRIGMTRAEVLAAAGEDANPGAVGGPNPDECDQFRPARAPQGLLVMLEDGILTRISLSNGTGIRTASGIGVGDPAAAVVAAHGAAAATTPHKYQEAPARYIVVWRTAPPAPDARGIVYEIGGDDRVMHIHAGGPSIGYVEGCL
ncbi:MAG TPA: hypothetical protein VK922_18270 [Gemmatimonadaceae bacterium]|nr:hypothetical protein [Gemmatimonadaceae bacterium]